MPSPSAGSGGGQASRGEMSLAKCENTVAVTQSPTRRKYKLSTVFLLPRTKSLVITFLKQTCVLPFFGQIQYYTVLHTVSHAVLVRLYVLCEMLDSNPKLSATWYETAGQIIHRGVCVRFVSLFFFYKKTFKPRTTTLLRTLTCSLSLILTHLPLPLTIFAKL